MHIMSRLSISYIPLIKSLSIANNWNEKQQ